MAVALSLAALVVSEVLTRRAGQGTSGDGL